MSNKIGTGIQEKVSGNVVAKYIQCDNDDDYPMIYYFYTNKTFEVKQSNNIGTASVKGSYTGDPASAGNTLKVSNIRCDESMEVWLTIAAAFNGMSLAEYQAMLAKVVITAETREYNGKIYLLEISEEGAKGALFENKNNEDSEKKSDIEKWEAGEYDAFPVKL